MGEQSSFSFGVNPPPGGGKRAIFPSLNMPPIENLIGKGADHYVAAMHASIGDMPHQPQELSSSIAAKALGIQVPQAYAFANFSFMPDANNWGLMQWPGINPESLLKICRENLAPQAIIAGRTADLMRYSPLASQPWEPGWRVVMRDPAETPTTQDKKDIVAAQKFIANGSRDFDDDPRERDAQLLSPLSVLFRLLAYDEHVTDSWALWTKPDRLGRPMAFANLPASLIRLAMPGQGLKGNKKYFSAMIDQTMNPVKMFTRYELTWSVLHPRTDPGSMGYGWPGCERAVRLVQGFQSAIDLNCDTFTRSGLPNGMLVMKGDYFSQEQIDAMMREWTNMKRGVSKLWGIPVMAIPDDSEIDVLDFMDMKGQDVRYKDHMNITMGLYAWINQFPVRRIGMFTSGMKRDNQPLPDESVEQQGVDDPGLPERLIWIENTLNPYILWPNWPRLKFIFENKDPKADARAYQERTKGRTWGESRAAIDLPSLVSIAPAHLKPLAEIMDLAPEDPAKGGLYQSIAATFLEASMGDKDETGKKDVKKVGAPFPSMKDPANSQSHGHRVGVRRSNEGAGVNPA